MRRLVLAAVSLAFLAACQPGVAPLTDEDVAALETRRTDLVQAWLASDCDASAAIYAEDAVSLPQDATILEGRTAIKAACEAEVAEGVPSVVETWSAGKEEGDGSGCPDPV